MENEGVEWSNKKIERVIAALKQLIQAFFLAYKENAEVAQETVQDEIINRSAFSKQTQITALTEALHTEALSAANPELVEVLRLQKLVDFQVILKHEISSADCKNLNRTRATLLFRIGISDGSVEERRLEVSLQELKMMKKELQRIEETLS